jgi:hypothetical protein
MTYFIKDAIEGKASAHGYFVRFGRGTFENRAILSIDAKKMQVKGSYENVKSILLWLFGIFSKCEVKGKILSTSELDGLLKECKLEFVKKKKEGLFEYDVSGNLENGTKLEAAYALLLDVKADGIEFRCKKRLPKPSTKSEKTDEAFFSLQLSKETFDGFAREFLFDVEKKGGKIKIRHDFVIEEIILPKIQADFEVLRKEAKRKGKIVRIISIDGKEFKKQYAFVA